MSFSYGFYNSLYGDRKYNAIQISQIFDGIINDGMYATIGNCMMVRESEQSNKVIVGSGRGWFNHTWNYNDSDSLLNCDVSDLVYPRIDAVVLDINRNENFRENSIKYVVGVANENPVKPTLANTGSHFQHPLAYITREPNSETITQSNIENMVGTSECPFVTGIIETINTDELIAQWQAQWNDFVINSEEDFLTWFEGLKDILDENTAAHLQNEINNINQDLDMVKTILGGGSISIVPKPMKYIFAVFDSNIMKYKLKWLEPDDTIIDGHKCIIEKVIIKRKLGSVPIHENDGELVTEIEKSQFGLYANTYFIDEDLTPTLGDIYYYKAFPLSTAGFYSSSEQNETDGILCKDYELYGYIIDQNESNPANMIKYIKDNKHFRSAYMDYVSDAFDYGDWADAFFMKIRPCMLKYDGTVDYYLNTNNYGLKEDGNSSNITDIKYGGNTMIQFPKVYWKIINNEDETATILICSKKIDNNFHCWSHTDINGNEIPYCYMPVYNGYNDGTRLRSLSGKTPIASKTAQEEVRLALVNNLTDVIWYTEVYSDRQMVDLLLLLIGKSTDTQTIFGTGNNNSGNNGVKATGTLDAKGLFYGNQDNVSCVKVFGMENWYGNQWRRIAGWINNGGTQKIKMTYGQSDGSTVDGYNFDGNGYITIPNTSPGGSSGGYISKMVFNENGIIPKVASGSATTYYTDGLWFNNGQNCYAFVGGNSIDRSLVGALYSNLGTPSSGADWHVGASLSCKPLA